MTMEVRREKGRVWIEGVKGFHPGEYASSPHGCQARILETLGEDLSYDDLLCYSGFAFRVGIHREMCPSAAHPCCGFMCMEGSNRALPWRMRVYEAAPWSAPKEDRAAFEAQACAAIADSIERGVPVHYGGEEDGLIIGYGDEGRRWLCLHPYHKGGRELFWHDEAEGFVGGSWPWGIVVWTEPKAADERVADNELTVAALQQAVEMWATERREAYYVGEAAYGHWLGWLHDIESGKVEDAAPGMQGNGWCYDVLVHSRRIAGGWLGQKADSYSGQAADKLRAAADHYTRIAELCMEGLDCPWDLTLDPQRSAEWTAELRGEQIARLEAAREHDRAAVDAIEDALGALSHGIGLALPRRTGLQRA
jgi:hypothetical protein